MNYTEVLTKLLLEGVLPLVAAIAIAYLAAWLKQVRDQIKDERLRAFVDELVRAAEQIYGDGAGEAKYEYVLRQAERDGQTLNRSAIEASVYWIQPPATDVIAESLEGG